VCADGGGRGAGGRGGGGYISVCVGGITVGYWVAVSSL